MSRVLITGHRGQLGQALFKTAPSDAELIGADLNTVDLTDALLVRALFDEQKPDTVINAAAYTAVDLAETDSDAAYRANRDLVENLALAARESHTRVLHISTDYVFDGMGQVPYRPDDPPTPRCVYGLSKLAGENVLREVLPSSSLIIRTAWLYSANGKNFLKTMLKLMAERESIGVVADQIGTPTSADSLAQAIWRAVGKPELSGILHWTDAGVASWYDFAVAIMEEGLAAGLLARPLDVRPIATSEYPTPARRPPCAVLDKRPAELALEMRTRHWRILLREVITELAQQQPKP